MVDKDSEEREAEAQKAYRAAREVSEDEAETASVSAALIDKVMGELWPNVPFLNPIQVFVLSHCL